MSVIDAAIERIRDLIASGQLAPGDRMPPEPELAAMLGVSRSSLREAVRALVQAKVLDVRRGDGTYVTSLEPQLLLSGLSFVMELFHDRTLLELFEVRRLLEPAATGLAARRVSSATIVEMRDRVDAMRHSATGEELIAHDIGFHRCVVKAAGNETLVSFLEALLNRTAGARIWRGTWEDRDVLQWTYAQHEMIVDALEQRDPSLAVAAATVHLAATEQWLRHLLEVSGVDLNPPSGGGARQDDASDAWTPACTGASVSSDVSAHGTERSFGRRTFDPTRNSPRTSRMDLG